MNRIAVHFNAVHWTVYEMTGASTHVTRRSGTSTDVTMLGKFQGSVRNHTVTPDIVHHVI